MIGYSRMALVVSLVGAAASFAGSAFSAPPANVKTSANPLYTVQQADAGAELYVAQCAMCHGRSLEGTFEIPALHGAFVARWSHGSLATLTGYVGKAMPQFAPGSLSPTETTQIVAYLLRENGYPAGSSATASSNQPIGLPPTP